MLKRKRAIILFSALSVLTAVMLLLCSCQSSETTFIADSLDDFSGRPIGIMQGAVYDSLAVESGYFNENENFCYYDTEVDIFAALESGKIDSAIMGKNSMGEMLESKENIVMFPEPVNQVEYAYAFPKGSELVEEFNEALRQIEESGLKDELLSKWYDPEDVTGVEGIEQDWPAENGTLSYWVNCGSPPLAFIGSDGVPTGYSVDLVKSAAKMLGYELQIKEANFNGLIAALQSGRADIAGRSVVVTEERKEIVDFSDPFLYDDVVLIARVENVEPSLLSGEAADSEQGVIEWITENFKKTFIEEDRWQLFLSGLLVTLCVAVLSAIIGTLCGFLVYLALRRAPKIPKLILGRINGFISGIPAVVVLMCLFYIVFQNTSLTGTIISVISFSLIFAISVYDMLILGVDAVSKGQLEAASALGLKDNDAFFSIVLPQAVRHVSQLYKKELAALINGTAIVGYIAVQDLTKVSDLIRSRTFEAFFPLIATALIYYFAGRILIIMTGKLLTVFEWEKSDNRRMRRLMKAAADDDRKDHLYRDDHEVTGR